MKRGKSKKMYEQVAEHIKTMIEQGHLQPGDKLPPMYELATRFGVSRATVREAFSSLVGMGLIDLRHGEGTFVQKIDVQTMITEPMNAALLLGRSALQELLEVRMMLETNNIHLACERATDEHLAQMQSALERMSARKQNEEEQVSADLQFHLAIAEAARNNVLFNLMNTLSESIRSQMHTRWEGEGEQDADSLALIEQHRELYAAIVSRDGVQAAELMQAHLKQTEAFLHRIRSQAQTHTEEA